MKKVLFIIPNLSHGGTNKCLENILPFLCKSYDISIISLMEEGIYKERFTPYNLFPLNIKFYKTKRNLFFRIINRLSNNIFLNILFKKHAIITERKLQPDLVVAFQEGNATLFTSHFTQRKIAWIHCDYKLYREIVSSKNELTTYNKFNKIICVSNYTKESFLNYYPNLILKTDFIYNLLDFQKIRNLASIKIIDSQFIFNSTTFTIISIGRYSEVKQFEKIPKIVSNILEKNPSKKIRWYIIGDGSKKLIEETKRLIGLYNLEKEVILLGAKDNPYPYIINSNLLVSLSRSEACPYVINEGKILNIPVLSTDYPSAKELIDNGKTGIISNINDFPEMIYHLIENTDNIYNKLKIYSDNNKYNNDDIILKINNLIDNIIK